MVITKDYKTFTLRNYTQIPQIKKYLSLDQVEIIKIVGSVLPFKVNNYVIDELIDWDNFETDPIYILTFPQKGMLSNEHYKMLEEAIRNDVSEEELNTLINYVRKELNPNPAGQMDHNVPVLHGEPITGVQHKYEQTLLFFPSHGQTCHAYCTFCFRWPQFVGDKSLKFARKETERVIEYIKKHPKVSDVLFTGGDPMTMGADRLRAYIEPFLELEQIRNIRIGTKSLAYWPYKYVNGEDSENVLQLFRDIKSKGKQVAFMAHFNHPVELSTPIVKQAVENILETGVQIRTQSPIMKHLNDSCTTWRNMWTKQVELGMIPYYMFIARDTGAQEFFSVPLVKAWNVFKNAYRQVSGLARTVKGPIMSSHPGKIAILGPTNINGEKKLALSFMQGRNPDWIMEPFFAEYDEEAAWLDDLKPAFGKKNFFFETELIDEVGLN